MRLLFTALAVLLLSIVPLSAQSDFENNFLSSYLSFEQFWQRIGGDYGTTFFPFLLNGYGGRETGLSGAFTAVADDVTTMEKNPAGTASLPYTELFFSHNKIMGDINYNTAAYSMRFNDLGFGAGTRILYTPFTHYDSFGTAQASGMITYSVFTFNVAYNFMRTYRFFGLSLGANAKVYVYGVPANIARNQTRASVVFDFGLLTRFNFLKAYKLKEKNFSFGFAVRNLGPFMDDEPPPTDISIAIAYKPIEPLMFSVDFNYLISYSLFTWKNWSVNTGIEWKFTKFTSLLVGATIKDNPSFSLGLNVEFEDFTVTATYTPDFIDVFQFSVSASLRFGDLGRKDKAITIKKWYANALRQINNGDYYGARDTLIQIIRKDWSFVPAHQHLLYCKKQIKVQEELEKINESEKILK
jgi:hypothetical protein